MAEQKEYLGDGVYAIYDGSGIILHANDLDNPTDRIYLEGFVIENLNNFIKRITSKEKKEGS